MNRLHEKLKDNEHFRDKIKFDETKNCLVITFHEYFEGNYAACFDEGYVEFFAGNEGRGHCHIQNDETLIKLLIELPYEDVVYIENTNANFFTLPFRVTKKSKFEKKKEKLMAKKALRIYTVDSIIKHNE